MFHFVYHQLQLFLYYNHDDNLALYSALDVCQSGDVLCITNGNWTGSAVVGDIMAGIFKNANISGIVTDGVVRDLAGLIEVGLPVYAQGITPNAGQKNGPGSVGLDISIGGVNVCSGDLVIADRDGVVVLPQKQIPTAIKSIKK